MQPTLPLCGEIGEYDWVIIKKKILLGWMFVLTNAGNLKNRGFLVVNIL